MIDIFLQIWGGVCYLLNKIFFSRAERNTKGLKRIWRMRSWIVYMIGLPTWVIVFISKHNWIAASVESGGAASMIVGFYIAWRGQGSEPGWLDNLAKISVLFGLSISCYEFGGINTIVQIFELGIAAGFLMGTYMMAKNRTQGYFWLMIGNISCAFLMHLEGYKILMAQQILSLVFVIDAYIARKRIDISKAKY